MTTDRESPFAVRQQDVLLRQFSEQASALADALSERMNRESAANTHSEQLEDWIAKAEGCSQALRDVMLLRRLGAHV